MAKYMLILGGADLDKRSGNASFAPRMFEQYMSWVNSLRERGHLVTSCKLYDQTGTRLQVRGGEIVDGPFVETKDAIGGYFIIEAETLEQATQLARDAPILTLQNGYVEVRAVER